MTELKETLLIEARYKQNGDYLLLLQLPYTAIFL